MEEILLLPIYLQILKDFKTSYSRLEIIWSLYRSNKNRSETYIIFEEEAVSYWDGRGDVRTDNSMSALTIWQDHRDIDWNWGESLSSQEQNDREERVLSCLCKVCKECERANTARLWSDRPTFWRLKWSKLLKASPQFTGKNDKLIFCYGIGLVQIQLKLTWHFLDKYLYYCAGKYQGSMTLPPSAHQT